MCKNFFKNILLYIIYSWLYIPIILLIINSFNSSIFGVEWHGFSLKWYTLLLNNSLLLQSTYHSIIIGILSATITTCIGLLTALFLYHLHNYIKYFISTLLFIVIMSPDIVMAISLLLLFMLLHFPLGFFSLLCAHITFCLPYVVIIMYSRLNNFDKLMLEAAKDLGANDIIIFNKIILPLILPAIISSWLLSFALSIDDITISSFVSSPSYETLPLRIYSMAKIGATPEINALATILITISIILVFLSKKFLDKYSKDIVL
ncbi:spermidine/putrescine ABC transporter permease PotC [Enterobacteriaceae endosymbiont of Neohaemonia nigricornis]|uniref:spermidine/putrescine ABC transporter permease PotC n=1 Tax=Enterobacteriaceae endosymbiont of Neohaemonia nigricornis TaxID=2675792 RepID=UPI001448DF82|nr:spermidine/putrescine ABC transporter permease PotC [Enterobacteriaceae endosymbiont of Neohaemonia nigricornis]QJC30595.1 spermidine/putrescine ABC transporter permease PotC [Enterobacteriaceae endosymbiont of Neohaemonia nigricornis]